MYTLMRALLHRPNLTSACILNQTFLALGVSLHISGKFVFVLISSFTCVISQEKLLPCGSLIVTNY